MIAQTKALEDENRRLKKMFAELSMQSKRRLRPIEFSVAFSGFGSWT